MIIEESSEEEFLPSLNVLEFVRSPLSSDRRTIREISFASRLFWAKLTSVGSEIPKERRPICENRPFFTESALGAIDDATMKGERRRRFRRFDRDSTFETFPSLLSSFCTVTSDGAKDALSLFLSLALLFRNEERELSTDPKC